MTDVLRHNYPWLLTGLAAAMSLLGFVLTCIDKRRAVRNGGKSGRLRRVPERVLLAVAVLLGAWGVLLGMLLLRHKTNEKRHPAFVNGVPVLAVLQGLGLAAVWLFR